MTVFELIEALMKFPPEATVYVDARRNAFALVDVAEVREVTPSEDAPNDEVYLEF